MTTQRAESEGMLDQIARLAGDGYATFPTQNKRPARQGDWRTAAIDLFPAEDTYPHGEYGVVLRADDLVVDVDPRNFPTNRKIWTELRQKYMVPDDIQKSRIVRSGGGGLHIYLRKPADFPIRKNIAGFPGVDFLTKGSYVLGPGSIVNGKPYILTQDSTILDAPIELLNAIVKQVDDFTPAKDIGFRDTDDNKKRYIEYLEKAEPAVEGRQGDATTFRIACRGRDYNLSPEVTFDLLWAHWNPKCQPMWSSDALQIKVRNAYKYNEVPPGKNDPEVVFSDVEVPAEGKKIDPSWVDDLDVTAKGDYKSTLKNAVLFIKNDKIIQGKFRYNEFTYKLELNGRLPWEKRRINHFREINDLEVAHIALHLAHLYRVEFQTNKIWDAILVCCNENPFHPIKAELEALKWDGVQRMDSWLVEYGGAQDSEYVHAIGRKTLIAAAARIYEPGVKFDHVLVLEGAQGIGKSLLCSIIGGKWFGDMGLDLNNPKDTIDYIHSHWVIEFGEMDTVRKADVNRLKAFISRNMDEARPPYARTSVRFPRQCVFIGTVNPDDSGYLNDPHGNRRFWPVMLTHVKIEELRKVRDQLFAEAVEAYKAGERLYLDPALSVLAEIETKQRVSRDPWTDIIMSWANANPDIGSITTEEIFSTVIGGTYTNFNTGHARRIAYALREAGFNRVNTGGKNAFIRPVEINGRK